MGVSVGLSEPSGFGYNFDMFRSALIAVVFSLSVTAVASICPARASVDDLLDGIVALEACDQDKEMYDELKCEAFLVGVIAVFSWQEVYRGIELSYCIADRRVMRLEDHRDIFVDWMNRNPTQLHGNSIGLFVKSMKEAYPCDP